MAESFYLHREIDKRAREHFAKLYSSESPRRRWLQLYSQTGHGNTSFLDQFRLWLAREWRLGKDTEVLYVDADVEGVHGGEPTNLGPLAHAVLKAHAQVETTAFRRLCHRLRRINWGNFALWFALALVVVTLILVLGSVQPDNRQPLWSTVWFVLNHPEEHWQEGLLAFMIAILCALLFEFRKKLFEEDSEEEKASYGSRIEEEIRYYGRGMIRVLDEIRGRRWHLVLLIDNAHKLPRKEREFLERLQGRSEALPMVNEFNSFAHRCRTTVIEHRNECACEGVPLQIPAFTWEEIKRICQSDTRLASLMVETRNSLIDSAAATGNIHAIFLEEKFEEKEKIRQEWEGRTELAEEIDERDLSALFVTQYAEIVTTDGLTALPASLYLEAFFPKREDIRAAAIAFRDKETHLFSKRDSSIKQNAAACQYLRTILNGSENGRRVLERAHFWWFMKLVTPFLDRQPASVAVSALSAEESGKIRRAAWHVLELERTGIDPNSGLEADRSGISAFFTTTRLSAKEIAACRLNAAASLLLALKINVAEGNLAAAREDAEHAIAWLASVRAADSSEPDHRAVRWLEFAAQTLWSAYWLTFDATIRNCIDDLAEDHPNVAKGLSWRIFKQYENLLKGHFEGTTPCSEPDRVEEPDLYNVWALTKVLRWIRERYGFTRKGLSQPQLHLFPDLTASGDEDVLVFPEPVKAGEAHWAEFVLLDMRATGFILRIDVKSGRKTTDPGNGADGGVADEVANSRIGLLPSLAEAERVFQPIRRKLDEHDLDSGSLTKHLKWLYFSTRNRHLLLNYYSRRTARTEMLFPGWKEAGCGIFSRPDNAVPNMLKVNQVEAIDADRRGLKAWLTELGFEEDSQGYGCVEVTKKAVRDGYHRIIALAYPLEYAAYLLKAKFWLGEYIWDYCQVPGDGGPADTKLDANVVAEWDELLQECVQIEEKAGWMLYTPPIHRIHWKYAEDIDRSAAVFDGMHLLEAFRRAGYPRGRYLEMHKRVRDLLINHGHQTGDHEVMIMTSRLIEEWATSECTKPMAWKYWDLKGQIEPWLIRLWLDEHADLPDDRREQISAGKSPVDEAELDAVWKRELESSAGSKESNEFRSLVLLEKCWALQWASQSARLANQLQRAELLLGMARKSIAESGLPAVFDLPSQGSAALSKLLRGLNLHIECQLACTLEALYKNEPPGTKRARYLAMWKKMLPTDNLAMVVLSSMVRMEADEGILAEVVVDTASAGSLVDGDNPRFVVSVPWSSSTRPLNRFYFRLLQALQLGWGTSRPDAASLDDWVANAQSLVRQNPGQNIKAVWNGQDSYGVEFIRLAGVENYHGYLGELRPEIVEPLRAICQVYEAFKDLEPAIGGYRLLMDLDTDIRRQNENISRYHALVYRHGQALTNILQTKLHREGPYAMAKDAFDRLSPFVNDALRQELRDKKIAESGQGTSYDGQMRELISALSAAKAYIERGDPRNGYGLLSPLMREPFCSSRSWIQLEQLEALEIWLRCAEQLGRAGVLSEEEHARHEKWGLLLHSMTVDFIVQIGDTLGDRRMKELARKWANMVRIEPLRT